MVCMIYSTIPTAAGLAVYLAGRPTETRPDTPASSVPSSSRAPSQPPEGRDLDWEDYNIPKLLRSIIGINELINTIIDLVLIGNNEFINTVIMSSLLRY